MLSCLCYHKLFTIILLMNIISKASLKICSFSYRLRWQKSMMCLLYCVSRVSMLMMILLHITLLVEVFILSGNLDVILVLVILQCLSSMNGIFRYVVIISCQVNTSRIFSWKTSTNSFLDSISSLFVIAKVIVINHVFNKFILLLFSRAKNFHINATISRLGTMNLSILLLWGSSHFLCILVRDSIRNEMLQVRVLIDDVLNFLLLIR